MSQQLDLALPEKPQEVQEGDGFYVYLIECQTPNHWYIGQSANLEQRWNQHWAGYGSVFIREHGFKRVAKTWGPFSTGQQARKVEDEKREQAARFFGHGAVCANGRYSRNIKGHIVSGKEATTLGRYNDGEASFNVFLQLNTQPVWPEKK